MRRALLIVLDSVGCGYAPDAAAYGDHGANTLGHILGQIPDLALPNLRSIGLDDAIALAAGEYCEPLIPGVGVLTEQSAGKDTTTGHWELAGVVLDNPFRTFERFPDQLVRAIQAEAGVQFIGNYPASGTQILEELGDEHLQTGKPILYTSADSVLQIAAHEKIVPLESLYKTCTIARRHCNAWDIGRVIARPFAGESAATGFHRTPNRHDYSLMPPHTVLNALHDAGIPVTGIGKISDIFAGSGVGESFPTNSNVAGMHAIDQLWSHGRSGLIFANLVDFDTLFGHRRDVAGYAGALREFDAWLGSFLPKIRAEDLVIITADHGNDPTWRGTDHTRERVPIWLPGGVGADITPGVRDSFADVAATLAQYFGIPGWKSGQSICSFAPE